MTAPAIPTNPAVYTPGPSKPIERGAATSGSQRDRRFTDTFFDTYRHAKFPNGRPFTGQREFQSGAQTESIAAGFITTDLQRGQYFCDNPEMGQTPQERLATIASVWESPWLPIAKYWRFNNRAKRVTFALEVLIQDEQNGLRKYWEAAAKLAGENDIIDPERPLAVPFRIRTMIGDPMSYLGKVKLARAAQAGDPWLMGAEDTPNEELAKILGMNVQYLGAKSARFGDAEYVTTVEKKPEPLIQPEQVLSTPNDQLLRLVAELSAKVDALSQKKETQRKSMAKARSAKKPHRPEPAVGNVG